MKLVDEFGGLIEIDEEDWLWRIKERYVTNISISKPHEPEILQNCIQNSDKTNQANAETSKSVKSVIEKNIKYHEKTIEVM